MWFVPRSENLKYVHTNDEGLRGLVDPGQVELHYFYLAKAVKQQNVRKWERADTIPVFEGVLEIFSLEQSG